MASERNSAIDLREFVKSENERLYNFCLALLEDEGMSEDVLLETFEKFVRTESKHTRKAEWEDNSSLRVSLYRFAWEFTKHALMNRTYSIENGRDTRGMKGIGTNLLAQLERTPEVAWERLCLVETEFRAPLVLKDLLGFDDDEVMEILDTRWGVYRHRLHRGRMEFVEHLTGSNHNFEASSEVS